MFPNPAQGQEPPSAGAILSEDKMGLIAKMPLEAITYFPQVRDRVCGHDLFPDRPALIKVRDNMGSDHDYSLKVTWVMHLSPPKKVLANWATTSGS